MTAIKERLPIYIYILLLSDQTHYTGITQDITIRLRQHNKGYSKSTRYKLPVELIYIATAKDRKTARKLEIKIKKRNAKKYLLDLRYKYNQPYQNQIHTLPNHHK